MRIPVYWVYLYLVLATTLFHIGASEHDPNHANIADHNRRGKGEGNRPRTPGDRSRPGNGDANKVSEGDGDEEDEGEEDEEEFEGWEKKEILDAHNRYRAMIRATNMIELEWSEELADIAQDFSEECNITSNELRNNLSTSFPRAVGENRFFGAEGDDYLVVLEIWHSEHEHYDYGSNICSENECCNNYTQLVWARTRYVGCGVTMCSEELFNFVCNYGPGGNKQNRKPYIEGKQCSDCPKDYECNLQQLCEKCKDSGKDSGHSKMKKGNDQGAPLQAMTDSEHTNKDQSVIPDEPPLQGATVAPITADDSMDVIQQDNTDKSRDNTDKSRESRSRRHRRRRRRRQRYCRKYPNKSICQPSADPSGFGSLSGSGSGSASGSGSGDDGGGVADDPHFSVKLSDGNVLCYTVQGEQNSYFNILTNDVLKVNAKFIPDDDSNNTWLGEIGLSVYNAAIKNTTKIKFDISNFHVNFNGEFSLDAHQIERLIITKGKLLISSLIGTPHVRIQTATINVEFRDMKLNFTVRFIKHHHLDMFWESKGKRNIDEMDGLIGQFLRKGVKIDVKKKLLILPGGMDPVPVKLTPMWNFMEMEALENKHFCWTAIRPSSQAKGVIHGSYLDYKVPDIFSAGFNNEVKMASNYTT